MESFGSSFSVQLGLIRTINPRVTGVAEEKNQALFESALKPSFRAHSGSVYLTQLVNLLN